MESSSFTFSSRRILLGALMMAALLLAMNWAAFKIFRKLDSNDYIGRSISENPEAIKPRDVLFIGDSRTNQGVSPWVFNDSLEAMGEKRVDAYNLGRPGMQTPFIYLILNRYARESGAESTPVFANISFYLLHGRGWLDDVYLTYYTPDTGVALDAWRIGLLSPYEAAGWYVSTRVPMLRSRKRAKGLLREMAVDMSKFLKDAVQLNAKIKDREAGIAKAGAANQALQPVVVVKNEKKTAEKPRSQNAADYHNNGYASRGFTHITAEQAATKETEKNKQEELFVRHLHDVFRMADERKMPVFIYEFPWPQPLCDKGMTEVIEHYREFMRGIVAQYQYVRMLEHDYCWPVELFVDTLHLNQPGAERLSKQIAAWYRQEMLRGGFEPQAGANE